MTYVCTRCQRTEAEALNDKCAQAPCPMALHLYSEEVYDMNALMAAGHRQGYTQGYDQGWKRGFRRAIVIVLALFVLGFGTWYGIRYGSGGS